MIRTAEVTVARSPRPDPGPTSSLRALPAQLIRACNRPGEGRILSTASSISRPLRQGQAPQRESLLDSSKLKERHREKRWEPRKGLSGKH